MNDEDDERVYELAEALWTKVHDLVDEVLANEKLEVAEEVRDRMTETFRFWKR